jgi:hypothetical protein
MAVCTIEGCERKCVGRGLCRLHYDRWWKHGNPHFVMRTVVRGSLRARFEAFTLPDPSGCLLWTGAIRDAGYGVIGAGGRGGKSLGAHRVAWELHKGPIPDGLHCLHRCDNPRCVNVDHLFLGTNQDNIADRVRKGRSKAPIFRGEDHAQAKLTDDDVRRIREDGRFQRVIAAEYGVGQALISKVKRREAWQHVA